MDTVDAMKLMLNEIECVKRAATCDRNCSKCDLVRNTDDLLQAYAIVMKSLNRTTPKKPIVTSVNSKRVTHRLGVLLSLYCPVCHNHLGSIYETDVERGGGFSRDMNGCSKCLQAIDFTEYYKQDKADEDVKWSD